MSTKRRRKKNKQKTRRQQRARRAKVQARRTEVTARRRRRRERHVPRAWAGETPEDVALFDDAVLSSLPPDLAAQVSAVREALQLASEGRGEDALKQVSTIPRSSPLREWRVYLRGLVPWLANDFKGANEAWRRLDPERRAGRIAAAMMNALDDLEGVAPGGDSAQPDADRPVENTAEPIDSWLTRLDDQLLRQARLLRRFWLDRAALRVAEAGAGVPDESPKLKLGPRKMRWLKEFADEYRDSEPNLVAALEQVALGRAFAQNYADLFDTAVGLFRGPRHDRNNRLLRYFYHSQFRDDPTAERTAQWSLDTYLKKDLPENRELSEPLRQAIVSLIHLNQAETLLDAGKQVLPFWVPKEEDSKAIRQHFKQAVLACPTNRRAYRMHAEWVESKLENDRLTKPQRKPWETELAQVMENWTKALPDDAQPRLWLVDHLLENEQTEDAQPHVEWLAASRHEDPRVRAAPWKWTLLEAMRLSRRKAWLSQVPPLLQESEQKWPSWLSKQWLPYLEAAYVLRCGDAEEFERQRRRICEESGLKRDCVADACMMLGAAQRMRVPAADLKPLRAPVDEAVKNVERASLEDLLDASVFFWDLYRARLVYPAYRMHGGKFARELLDRLWDSDLVLQRVDDPKIHAAVLWNSEHRFWGDSYVVRLPAFYSPRAVKDHPMFVAAKANALLNAGSGFQAGVFEKLGEPLREAAAAARDPYYRHWFHSLAEKADQALAAAKSRAFGVLGGMFGFGADQDDGDDDWDDVDEDEFGPELGFDPHCDCPGCRAARARYEATL